MAVNGTSGVSNGAFDSINSGESWLVAIAKALGKALGDKAEIMKKHADNVGSKDPKVSAEANAQIQAESQLYSLITNSVNTVIKSIGESNSNLARKN